MNCPYCDSCRLKVTNSRHIDKAIVYRTRQCVRCKKKFNTIEEVDTYTTILEEDKDEQVQ